MLLGLLPSFAWLFFFLKEDVHPEPKKMIAKIFFLGALSTFLVIIIQFFLQDILQSLQIKDYDPISFFFFGVIEEVFKFLAVYLVVRKSRFFDEPIDAMIYMIAAALGFAAVENMAVMSNISAIQEAFGVITMRFVGATLLHALSSGVVGYYWGKGIILSRKLKEETGPPCRLCGAQPKLLLFKGIVFATLLHMIFNCLIMVSKDVVIYPTIFLIIAALFIFWDFERLKSIR
jgi:RsiW-degrading membrane proteinase PrsW (M82 family)